MMDPVSGIGTTSNRFYCGFSDPARPRGGSRTAPTGDAHGSVMNIIEHMHNVCTDYLIFSAKLQVLSFPCDKLFT